jgi:hypothetical protein
MSRHRSRGLTFEKTNHGALSSAEAYKLDAYPDDAIRLHLRISHLTCDRHFD